MFERLKQFFERLVRINQEEFKGAAPDCCKINRSKPRPKAEGNGPKNRNADSGFPLDGPIRQTLVLLKHVLYTGHINDKEVSR